MNNLNDLLETYMQNQALASQNSVRIGIYSICRIESITRENWLKDLTVDAEWKPNEDSEFSLPVRVQLAPLFNKHASGFKDLSPNLVVGCTIEIHSVEQVTSEYGGKAYNATKVHWSLIGRSDAKQESETPGKPEADFSIDQFLNNKPADDYSDLFNDDYPLDDLI